MKHRSFHRLTSALCALVMLLALVPAAQAAGTPAVSDNIFDNYYQSFANHTYCYMFANSRGGLSRLEFLWRDEKLILEDYNDNFQLQSSREITMELPLFGGFFEGKDFYFLFFGQYNTQSESDSVEAIRIVKYDKSWNRLGQTSVKGVNTTIPFDGGSAQCAEAGGMLYVLLNHQMYRSADGKNHQSNMQLVLRESDMRLTETNCTVSGYFGYVSHSMNGYLLMDQEGNLVAASQGDGHPRAMVLFKTMGVAGKESINANDSSNYDLLRGSVQTADFQGAIGDNKTNASLGGLVETSSGYLIAYSQREILTQPDQVKLAYIAKSAFHVGDIYTETAPNTLQIRQLTSNSNWREVVSTPWLVSTGLSGGWVLWNTLGEAPPLLSDEKRENKGLYYATYNADGSTGPVQVVPDVPLSSCQPIYWNGKVVWYVTDDSAPVFYTLDASGVKSYPANGGGATPGTPSGSSQFTDVAANHWALDAIQRCVDAGAATGYGGGKFGPEDTVTSAQFIAMLTRAVYNDKLSAVSTPAGQPWYYASAKVAEETGMSEGVTVNESPMTRYEMARALSNVIAAETLELKTSAVARRNNAPLSYNEVYAAAGDTVKSWGIPSNHSGAVQTCVTLGVLTGMSDGTFSGENTMTRAQACAVITRMMDLMDNKVPSTFYGN